MNWKTELNLYVSCEGNSLVLIHLTRLLLERRIKLTVMPSQAAFLALLWLVISSLPTYLPPAMWEIWVQSLGWKDSLEKGTATSFSILAWRIPQTVQSTGSQRIGHDWATFTLTYFSPVSHPQSHPHSFLFRLTRLRLWLANQSWSQVCEVKYSHLQQNAADYLLL